MPGNCVPHSAAGGASKLLRSGCAAKIGSSARGCDSAQGFDSLGETIVRSRTDSASLAMMALMAKKQEAARAPRRPDRGFIR
jgi:hypothetical protein